MQVFHFETTDSTNEAAKRLIRSGVLREPSWLLAREQTAGKGTRGRTWLSPKDAGIYLTVVELPDTGMAAPHPFPLVRLPVSTNLERELVRDGCTAVFTLAAGAACVEALKEAAGVNVRLKPINDLYVGGRKLGGILTETILRNGFPEAIVTGVGVNVRRAERRLPVSAVPPICLEEVLPAHEFACVDGHVVVARLVAKIRFWNRAVLRGRIDAVTRLWERYKVPT